MQRRDDGRAWGRSPGARPPLAWWSPLALWVASAVTLTLLVAAVIETPAGRDDPDPAEQRAGFLISGPEIDSLGLGLPLGERPVVLVFDRTVPAAERLRRFTQRVEASATTVLVVPSANPSQTEAAGVRVVGDPRGRIADRVGLREPVDGGSPVGYAVIDAGGRVRYATLDPTYLDHPFEIEVITEGLR